MRSYEAPRISSVRIADVLTDLGPARANLYEGCDNDCGDGGSEGWWW